MLLLRDNENHIASLLVGMLVSLSVENILFAIWSSLRNLAFEHFFFPLDNFFVIHSFFPVSSHLDFDSFSNVKFLKSEFNGMNNRLGLFWSLLGLREHGIEHIFWVWA